MKPTRAETMAAWRLKNKVKIKADRKEYHSRIRNTVLNHYGGWCELCSTNDRDVLTVDHIWGDGHEHRKSVSAAQTYSWLVKNNFPPGFRILCHNCNYKARLILKDEGVPPMSLQTLQREIYRWANKNFPSRTAESVKNKLEEELAEWADNPDDADEFADCLILILDWCYLKGVNMQDAVNKKMRVNLKRHWILDPSNKTWHHTHEPDQLD